MLTKNRLLLHFASSRLHYRNANERDEEKLPRAECTAASRSIYLGLVVRRGWSNQPFGCLRSTPLVCQDIRQSFTDVDCCTSILTFLHVLTYNHIVVLYVYTNYKIRLNTRIFPNTSTYNLLHGVLWSTFLA